MDIRCRDICIFKLNFERFFHDEDNLTTDENDEVGIPVNVDFNYAENINSEEKNSKLELHFTVGDKEGHSICKFELVLAGIFEWDELSSDEAENQIMKEGAQTLFSFARTLFYDFTKNAGMPGLILPYQEF